MKKIRIILIMAVAFIAANITVSAQTMDDLREAVKLLNAECPQDMGDGMVMQSINLDGQTIKALVMTKETD